MIPEISEAAPFFIVSNLQSALSFYRDRLGFQVVFEGPPGDPFFGIVRRGGAMIMLKDLGERVDGKEVDVEPVPNYGREPAHCLDAHIVVPDPDALAAEFASRGVQFSVPLNDSDDGLRGFVLKDADGHGLFFGRVVGP